MSGLRQVLAPILLLIVAAASCTPAFARAPCGTTVEMAKHLRDDHHQDPVAFGVQSDGSLLQVWASKGGRTWTIVTTTPTGQTCERAGGKSWTHKDRGAQMSEEQTAAAGVVDQAAGATTETAAAETAVEKAARPEYVPEKFWDADAGTVRTEDVFKSYGQLEQERLERTKRVPEDYQLPGSFKGFEDQLPAEQLKAVKELAKGEGYSQRGFEQLMQLAFGDPGGGRQALEAEFGDKTDETLEACRLFANTLGDHEAAVRRLTSFPEGVKLLNAWRQAAVEKGLPGTASEGGAGKKTEAELAKMMQDPRYWREKDPAYIDEVTRGYQQLYGGKVQTAALNAAPHRTA